MTSLISTECRVFSKAPVHSLYSPVSGKDCRGKPSQVTRSKAIRRGRPLRQHRQKEDSPHSRKAMKDKVVSMAKLSVCSISKDRLRSISTLHIHAKQQSHNTKTCNSNWKPTHPNKQAQTLMLLISIRYMNYERKRDSGPERLRAIEGSWRQ